MSIEEQEIKKALKPFEISINDRLTKLKMIIQHYQNLENNSINYKLVVSWSLGLPWSKWIFKKNIIIF